MKKYIVSILVASVFLIGTPFLAPKASAADLNIRDFINLLVAIGVIPPDRMPAVNAFLATLDNTATPITPIVTPVTPPTTKSLITILSPNGGERYDIGSPVPIRWSASNLPPQANNRVSISLVGFSSHGDLVSIQGLYPAIYGISDSSVLNNGSSLGTIPTTVNPGNRYKIRINPSCQGCFGYDDSDNYFTITSEAASPTVVTPSPVITPVVSIPVSPVITSPTITVTSPNRGNIYHIGDNVPITWETSGIVPSTLMISYQPSISGATERYITDVSTSLGKYLWTIPDDVGEIGPYLITVSLGDGGIAWCSSSVFSIADAISTSTQP